MAEHRRRRRHLSSRPVVDLHAEQVPNDVDLIREKIQMYVGRHEDLFLGLISGPVDEPWILSISGGDDEDPDALFTLEIVAPPLELSRMLMVLQGLLVGMETRSTDDDDE